MRSLFLLDVELVDRSEPIEEPKLFEIPEFNMNSNFLQESFEKLSPRFDEEMHKQEQADLLELLRLCKYGDQHKKEYMLTKNYYVGNENGNLTDIYINSCYPIEISTPQGARSMGHCSDFILFVYYAGARLNPAFAQDIHEKHIANCPKTTYIHGEYPIKFLFELKQRNYWMPNVEQVKKEQAYLIPKTDMFLAKTLKSLNVIQDYLDKQGLRIPIEYTAHSSPDPLFQVNHTGIERSFTTFYHGNGHSGLKSTNELIECWKGNPNFPILTIVGNKEFEDVANIKSYKDLSISKVRALQYENGIHICPSTREGYGHYINEARAMGAFLITTNYGPMNEFVDDRSGLRVNYEFKRSEDHQLFKNVQVKVRSYNICDAVKETLEIHPDIRTIMGQNGRENYERDYVKMVASKKQFKKSIFEYYFSGEESARSLEDMENEIDMKFESLLKSVGSTITTIGGKTRTGL